ncbi:venom allergen 5-like [Onthophagus taurus]|uniref:venom allergen 5-like n=1 Tax=Onthophagus taurus TaxID=166361 RepID=UPI0039BDDED4
MLVDSTMVKENRNIKIVNNIFNETICFLSNRNKSFKMTLIKIFVIISINFLMISGKALDYCDNALSCNGVVNSGCDCEFGGACNNPKNIEPSDDVRNFIVEIHNKYREKVASGSESRGGLTTGASDMYALEYDKDLEYTSTCWNKKCTFSHDKCRSTPDFQPAGQNLYFASGKATCDWKENFKEAIYLWYEEVNEMTNDCVRGYATGCVAAKVGDFAQLVWAKTTHVGCSLVSYSNNTCQLICNYGPAGNYQTEKVFVQGEPASECEYRSANFKHLCAKNLNQAIAKKSVGLMVHGESRSGNSFQEINDANKQLEFHKYFLLIVTALIFF